MTSAFNSTPGGCCCTVPSNWFDVYLTGPAPAGRAVRLTTLRPNGSAYNIRSDDSTYGVDWYVPTNPLTVTHTVRGLTLAGYPASGGKWWSMEQRPTSGNDFLVFYDSDTKQELFNLAFPNGGFDPSPLAFVTAINQPFTRTAIVAGSQDCFLLYLGGGTGSNFGLYRVNATGAASYSFTPTTGEAKTTVNAFKSFGTTTHTQTITDRTDCFAWRHAPRGAGSHTSRWVDSTNANGSPLPDPAIPVTQESRLFFGDVAVIDGILQIINQQTAVSVSEDQLLGGQHLVIPNQSFQGRTAITGPTTTYSWVYFDSSPTHWVGIVHKAISARTQYTYGYSGTPDGSLLVTDQPRNYLQILINGAVVQEIQLPTGWTTPDYGLQYFGNPHVCHPHETLGDGWVAIPTKIYTTYPFDNPPSGFGGGGPTANPGTLTDVNNPWKVVVYKDGVESWRTPAIWKLVVPEVHQSSDRWLYISDITTTNPLPANPPDDHWRHDGAMHFRSGQLTTDGSATIPDQHNANQFTGQQWVTVTKGSAVVQNSSRLPGTIPAVFPPT